MIGRRFYHRIEGVKGLWEVIDLNEEGNNIKYLVKNKENVYKIVDKEIIR